MMYGITNAGVKGLYHDSKANPISKDCFGAWMDADIAKLGAFAQKLDDPWSIKADDAKAAFGTLVDMHYKNFGAC